MSCTYLMRALLLLAGFLSTSASNTFLHAQASGEISTWDVEQALASELSGLKGELHLLGIQEELSTMYASLPHDASGKLEPSTVRYALHRYFVHKHGWFLKGLEPAGGQWEVNSHTSIMKHRAPAYIQSIFQKQMQGNGFGLNDLAIFAATLSDLVHAESVASLQGIFAALELPTVGPVARSSADMALRAWLATFLIGGNATISHASEVVARESQLQLIYPMWPETRTWASDLREAHEVNQGSIRNPFVESVESFDELTKFVMELSHRLGSFQNLECRQLKDSLLEMEHQGTGRVPLSRFYKGMVDGTNWQFGESVDYLRDLGALDETDPRHPSVVITNYVNSPANCLTSSSFYSVCCLNECENLMGHIEQDIASPLGEPARIAEVVSGLQSDTVEAPRNLSSPLLTRLAEIANRHSGVVPLHGRLFAQWMHHAYPRECPFPLAAGTTTPMTPEEWIAVRGPDGYVASEQEMKQHVEKAFSASSMLGDEERPLPWSAVEELVAVHRQMPRRGFWCARTIFALTALLSLAVPLVCSARAALQRSLSVEKFEKCLV